jgi:hypothetical protein
LLLDDDARIGGIALLLVGSVATVFWIGGVRRPGVARLDHESG